MRSALCTNRFMVFLASLVDSKFPFTSTKMMISMLTCVSPGEGAGCGTDTGPVIGCGGLFISCAFVSLHQAGSVLPEYLETVTKT